ncbi:hypothetical protein [Rubritalea tangerina]|uniref:hypothetical protein n=1 Tax=Rubritalea tangerina TaxID=430798 RepID=UPI00361E457F
MILRVLASLSLLTAHSLRAEFQTPIDEQWILSEDKKNVPPITHSRNRRLPLLSRTLFPTKCETENFLKTMQMWKRIYKNSPPTRATQLLNRQTILDYEANKAGSAEALMRILELDQVHLKQNPNNQMDKTPSTLDPNKVNRKAFLDSLGTLTPNKLLNATTKDYWRELISNGHNWTKQERITILKKITRPDTPGILPLIVENFKEPGGIELNQIACANQLSLKQLDTIATQIQKSAIQTTSSHYASPRCAR